MRRRILDGSQVPPMLATFTPTDWPGRTTIDRLAIWKEARHAWHEAHGWPGGAVAMIRGHRDVRRRLTRRLNGDTYDPRNRTPQTSTPHDRKA